MENMQIKKNNSFEFFNGKSNLTKKEDDTKLILMTKSNNKPRIINNKLNNNSKGKNQTQNLTSLNPTNALTLLKDNVLALFPCDGHMAIFDDIENIITNKNQ